MGHILIQFAIRATLIAAGTAAVLAILRVRVAAARHRAWAGVAILMLLLPLWTAWGPTARLRLLPAVKQQAANPPDAPLKTIAAFPQLTPPAFPVSAAAVRSPIWNWTACLESIYFLGLSVLLARLIIGTLRAHLLVRRATTRGGRLTSDACAAPVTVGWLKPSVILPAYWQTWPRAQLDAVLTHEGEHARRRDPLVQWLALLNRAVFWFHPLAWWLECKLSALAEEACDAAVLARGHDPFEYSEYLLEIARSVLRTGARVNVLGMAMPGSFLPQRIRLILEGRPAQRISRVRMACLGVACATVSALFATGAVVRRMPAQAPSVMLPSAPQVSAPVADLPDLPIDAPAKRHQRTALLAQVQTAPVPPAPTLTEPRYQDRRLVVLYFDLRTMPAADRSRAFAAAQEFVRTKVQANDLLSIITENDGMKVRLDFTADREQLLRTLDQLAAEPGPDSGADLDADRPLLSLHTAVNLLAVLNGRKTLICFTEPIGQRTDSAELRPLIDAAIRANVAFYGIDVRGLIRNADPKQQQLQEELQKLGDLAKRQQELAASHNNVIGAADALQIGVAEQQGISGMYTQRPDGFISVPMVGDIKAAGLTTAQLEAVIADRLRANQILSDASVSVSVSAVQTVNKTYVIGPEDQLEIRVAEFGAMTATYTVRPDGTLSMPIIGSVKAAGLMTLQLEAVIADGLKAYVGHPTVSVTVARAHGLR